MKEGGYLIMRSQKYIALTTAVYCRLIYLLFFFKLTNSHAVVQKINMGRKALVEAQ